MLWLARFYAERAVYILSPEIAKNFLKNANNYTPNNIQQIATALDIIKNEVHSPKRIESKNQIPKHEIDGSLLEYQSKMITLVNKINPTQMVSLMKSMSLLEMKNDRLWTLFENHIMRNFQSFQSNELANLIDACAYSSRSNEFLWDWFEEKIIQHFDGEGKIAITDVYIIIKSFASQKKGSKNLFRILNEKIIESIDQMNGKEYSAMINAFSRTRNINKDVVATMISSYDKFKSKIMGNGIGTILAFFVKNNIPKHKLDEIQNHFLENLPQMNLASLAGVCQAYGEKFGETAGGNIQAFVGKIEDFFYSYEDELTRNLTTSNMNELLLTLYWGIERVKKFKKKEKIQALLRNNEFRNRVNKSYRKLMIDYLEENTKGGF